MLLLGHALVGGEGQQAAAGGGRVHPLQPRVALDLLQGGSLLRVPLQHPGDETGGEKGDAVILQRQANPKLSSFTPFSPPQLPGVPWGRGTHPPGQRVGVQGDPGRGEVLTQRTVLRRAGGRCSGSP